MIGQTLSHFRITAKLGEGGMGEVYRAEDTKLGREVAIKVLPAEMASSPERLERFQREAQALAALDHPGIVTVYSVEESAGLHFLAMQLVEGEPLDRLIPEKGLGVDRILEIGTAVAEALVAAHEKGIVHRDLKPSNIMVTGDGRVKVLDFGLAKFNAPQPDPPLGSEMATELHTRAGVVMGTVPYMSPEQVSGRAVDEKTDLFSLGVVLYEMATGLRPFEGPSSAELVSSILRDTPRPLVESRIDLPEPLAQVIGRCLEKNAADRIPSARALRDALAAVGGAPPSIQPEVAPTLRAASAADSGATRAEEGFWIAVLPFKYTGADADVTTLAEGLAEEIVTGLSRFSYLRVVAHGSTLGAVEDGAEGRTAGTATGARYSIEGSLRQAGTKLRLAVQLVDKTTGTHLWAENYERTFSSEAAFELQDDLVPRIVSTVADMNGVLPRSMGEAVRSRNSDQLSPYEAVLRSFAYFERVTADELAAARLALEQAVQKAPDYADAWAMLALLCAQEYGQGFDLLADSLASGAEAARKAIEAGPANHLAHFSLAQVLFFQKDFQTFRNAAERAATLNPMDGNSIAFLGEMMTYSGDFERGLALADRAKQLNPNHPGWYWYTDFFYLYRQRDHAAALDVVRKVNLPGHWGQHVALAVVCGQLGDCEGAGRALENLLDLRPDFPEVARQEFGKWWDKDFVEHMIDGLRKAGLDVPSVS